MALQAQARVNLTDRAKRYRAQKSVTGERVCVFCGSRENLGVMHLDGNEDHGEPANLAWGCKSCNGVLAAAFKKIGAGKPTNQYNPSTGVPTYAQYAWAVSNHSRGAHDEGGAVIHATPRHKRIEYAKRIAEVAGRTKQERFSERWNVAKKSAFEKCVESVKKGGSATDPRAVCAAAGRRKYGQAEMTRRAVAGKKRKAKNPAEEAAEVFEEFHGYEPDELVVVEKQVHHHEHLAAAGELVGLAVKPVGHGLPVREIGGLEGAILAFNERKNQLFVTGGDQALSWDTLQEFGIETEHELQTIGKLVGVSYETDKSHLGDEGGHAIYSHTFRTTNENGVHITVRIARYPDLIYRVLDEQFEISGGDYDIKREGIDK